MTKKTLSEWLDQSEELKSSGPVYSSSYEYARARVLALNIKDGLYEGEELVEAEKEARVRRFRWVKAMMKEDALGISDHPLDDATFIEDSKVITAIKTIMSGSLPAAQQYVQRTGLPFKVSDCMKKV